MWDVGGQDKIRPLWRHYFQNTQGLIFVVDSNDSNRIDAARDELHRMLAEDHLRDAALLVFANKQDAKGALNAEQVSSALGLHEIKTRQWSISETAALSNPAGLFEGFDWVVTCIKGGES